MEPSIISTCVILQQTGGRGLPWCRSFSIRVSTLTDLPPNILGIPITRGRVGETCKIARPTSRVAFSHPIVLNLFGNPGGSVCRIMLQRRHRLHEAVRATQAGKPHQTTDRGHVPLLPLRFCSTPLKHQREICVQRQYNCYGISQPKPGSGCSHTPKTPDTVPLSQAVVSWTILTNPFGTSDRHTYPDRVLYLLNNLDRVMYLDNIPRSRIVPSQHTLIGYGRFPT